jgi:hypothetical protein
MSDQYDEAAKYQEMKSLQELEEYLKRRPKKPQKIQIELDWLCFSLGFFIGVLVTLFICGLLQF